MGLAFDDWDLDYYTNLFRDDMGRDPTNVELFDIAQSNSEHSRHWFFRGDIVIDGVKMPSNLFNLVKEPWKVNPNNSVVAFKDNSSAIRGFKVKPMLPVRPGAPSPLAPQDRDWDLLLTAETHNFPCAVAPFPGAETGAGGRMRDTHATGTGSIMGAGTAGYCVGNLHLDGAEAPWEDKSFQYPPSLASPQQILIDASNGASDYGNKFGEPLICGYTRTFGQRLPNGERREWIKPIMFSGGIGQIDNRHLHKADGEISMLVVKIGGPAYRIGMGGGAASSVPSGSNNADLDFNAVQRGDAEMSQKLWRVVRSCVEMGDKNPIVQIHDQGAGGNCNVVKVRTCLLGCQSLLLLVGVGCCCRLALAAAASSRCAPARLSVLAFASRCWLLLPLSPCKCNASRCTQVHTGTCHPVLKPVQKSMCRSWGQPPCSDSDLTPPPGHALLAPAQEIIYPLGAEIDVRAVKVGDETLSVMEIWGAEYQENDCLLIRPEARDLLQSFCDRERCLMQVRATRGQGQPRGGRGRGSWGEGEGCRWRGRSSVGEGPAGGEGVLQGSGSWRERQVQAWGGKGGVEGMGQCGGGHRWGKEQVQLGAGEGNRTM